MRHLNTAQSLQLCPTLCRSMDCSPLLSLRLSMQEYGSGLPCPSAGDLPNPGTEPASLISLELAGGFFTTEDNQRKEAVPDLKKLTV